MNTTFPLSDLLLSGGELSQATAPLKSGIGPSSLRAGSVSAALAARTAAAFFGWNTSIRCSSAFAVFTKENLVSRFVSQPRAIATTPIITATPNPRRIHTSNESERFRAEKTLLPVKSAIPREVAAPKAKDRSKNEDRAPGPCIAAPVKIKPRIGPAQGAQRSPVEIPSTKDFPIPVSADGPPCSLLPAFTSGRVN